MIKEKAEDPFTFFIYDLSGKIVFSQPILYHNTTINTSQLSQGIYICTLLSEEGVSLNRKLVISR
jgi:hypothetical protein